MIVLDKIVVSTTEPPWTRVLWVKPTKKGAGFYIFNRGWEPIKLIDSKETPYTQDDEIIDITGGGLGPDVDINRIVEQEVSRQLENHDENVGDTHNAPSSDEGEYPEVSL